LAARDLGPDVVSAAVLLAPPYGERDYVPGKLVQLLLRKRLIPPILLRPRFFSARTPRSIRRAIFRAAVRESDGIQRLTMEKRWFHTDFFAEHLRQRSLVIASSMDRVVPVTQSMAIAEVLGAEMHLFEEADGVAHDDLFASPEIIPVISDLMVRFVGKG
jgi:hypothetical protein